MGILFAFIAMGAWGLGDFLIQKSARHFGRWVALFYITAFAAVGLLPFIFSDIFKVFSNPDNVLFLFFVSGMILFASLFDFTALKIGKMSVIEPIFAMEVPTVAIFSMFILHERLSMLQTSLVAILIVGIFLVATKAFSHLRNIHMERGVWQAILATFGMGMTNFLFGVGSRAISPLMINWFTSLFMATVCLVYLFKVRRVGEIIDYWKSERNLVLGVSISDNIAWVAYSYSTLYIPIAIATGISESYIALAAGLGLYFNKEKLRVHQWVGLIITIASAVVLAMVTEG